jgi:lysozyme
MPSQKKDNRLWPYLALAAGAILISLAVLWINGRPDRRARASRYPAFGIAIPAGYTIHGIDVSHHQSHISWPDVQAMQVNDVRIGFTFIKATEGIGSRDPLFFHNWKKSKRAGIVRGAYHFFVGSKDGKLQAENFITKVTLEPGDLPPVLDIEQLHGIAPARLRREAKRWLETVEAYYGIRPILYTNVEFYNKYLGSEFDAYPLWVAHYYEPYQPRIRRGWLFWQHSDEGRVNGIARKVDFNVFSGDSTAFRSLLVPGRSQAD